MLRPLLLGLLLLGVVVAAAAVGVVGGNVQDDTLPQNTYAELIPEKQKTVAA